MSGNCCHSVQEIVIATCSMSTNQRGRRKAKEEWEMQTLLHHEVQGSAGPQLSPGNKPVDQHASPLPSPAQLRGSAHATL